MCSDICAKEPLNQNCFHKSNRSEPEFWPISVTWQLSVTLDNIHYSCDISCFKTMIKIIIRIIIIIQILLTVTDWSSQVRALGVALGATIQPRPLFTQIRVGGSQWILSYQSRKWKGKWEAKKRRWRGENKTKWKGRPRRRGNHQKKKRKTIKTVEPCELRERKMENPNWGEQYFK